MEEEEDIADDFLALTAACEHGWDLLADLAERSEAFETTEEEEEIAVSVEEIADILLDDQTEQDFPEIPKKLHKVYYALATLGVMELQRRILLRKEIHEIRNYNGEHLQDIPKE